MEVISEGKRLIIDLGLPLDAEKNDRKYLPEISGWDGSEDSLLAILISHPHLDHFGLLAHISPQIPVIMGSDARRILSKVSPFLPGIWHNPSNGVNFASGIPIVLGPFTITPFLMDHSAYDAYSILIEADSRRLFYSGDFRTHGRKANLTERLIAHPPVNIDVLMLEGSSLGRLSIEDSFPSETNIEQQMVDVFASSKGMSLVHTSSQNIDRIVSIFRACRKTGKTLVIDLYTAVILEATGNKNIPQSDWPDIVLYVPQSQSVQILNNRWFDLLKSHCKNRVFIEKLQEISTQSVVLFRPLHMRDFERANILREAIYVYSQWEGYWESNTYAGLRDWLVKHKIPKVSIHTSGHASPQDLQRFAEAFKPNRIVPIHTFKPEVYNELFNHVEIHADGEYWEV